jgi:hypothetical protein
VSLFPPFATGEAVSIVPFVDKTIQSTCSKLLYLSYATDWPAVSVGHPAGALAIFVNGFFDMVDLRFCVTFFPGEFYFPLYPCLLLGSGNSTHANV